MYNKITAIVPAFNEEKRIRHVLETLTSCSSINETICVNDKSIDATAAIAQSIPGIHLINLKTHQGKSMAIARGIQEASGKIILFIDADLKGLTDASIHLLIDPLLKNQYDVVIGYPSGMFDSVLFRPLSGERAYFKKDLQIHLSEIKKKGFGLELYLNYLFRDKKTKLVILENVMHMFKYQKRSGKIAMKQELQAWQEIFAEIKKQKNPARYVFFAYLKQFYIKSDETKRFHSE